MVQLSHPYMTSGKTKALTIWTFVGKIMSLLFNTLSRLIIAFLPRSKRLLVSRLQSPSAVILEPRKQSATVSPRCPYSNYSPTEGHRLASSSFWQLWIKLLQTSLCRLLCGHKFTIVRNCRTVFQSGCTILDSHQQWWGFLLLQILSGT